MRRPDAAVAVPTLAGGGAERTAITLAGYLDAHGYAVDLVCFRAQGPYRGDVPAGVELVDLGASRALYALPALVRYLRSRRPPALLAGLDRTIVLAVVAVRLARVDTRVVGQVQSTMSKAAAASSRWPDRMRPALARRFYGKAGAIVAVSDGVARDLVERIGLPEALVTVVPNPVHVDGIVERAGGTVPDPWFAGDAPPVVLGIGRLTRQKDFATLVRAFARARRRVEARLVVLGEGEDRDMLEQLVADEGVSDDVRLPGFVDDTAPYLGRAGVFVLSSAWEGLPLALLEALAVGTPVVAADCESGPREILDGGRHGRLVPVGDPEAMAEAIVEALAEEPDPEGLRARARDFAPEAVLPAYVDLLGPRR